MLLWSHWTSSVAWFSEPTPLKVTLWAWAKILGSRSSQAYGEQYLLVLCPLNSNSNSSTLIFAPGNTPCLAKCVFSQLSRWSAHSPSFLSLHFLRSSYHWHKVLVFHFFCPAGKAYSDSWVHEVLPHRVCSFGRSQVSTQRLLKCLAWG